MAEALISSGVKMILTALEDKVKSEIRLAWGAKTELEKLQDKMVVLQLILDDAESRQVKESSVRHWLEKLKNVAYEAQDVMDEVSYQANHPENNINVTNNWIDKVLNWCSVSSPFLSNWRVDTVLNFCSSSNPFRYQSRMAHMIQDINGEFDKIKKEMEEFNFIKGNLSLGPINPSDTLSYHQEETSYLVNDSSIVGRETAKSELVALLTASKEGESLSVLPIVGMGGLGKTTLTQLVYNDERVQGYFKDLLMWVHVSEDFDIYKVLRDIITRSTKENSSSSSGDSSLQDLVGQLRENLGGKLFLLVLDNVWNRGLQKWEDLKMALGGGAKGSKIIVTTRQDEVASLVGTLTTYKLSPLLENDAWPLLKEKAFKNSARSEEREDLVEVGKRIAKKCGGVPLALVLIGSQLRSRGEDLDSWRYIENSELWGLPELEGIFKPLMVSYHLLPSQLRQCFSYCSVFRKGESIQIETIVQLWMAEGFMGAPRPSGNGNIKLEEDVGREYAKNLLHCSFFQAEEWDKSGTQVVSFKIHDLVHDLAQSVVSEADRTSVLVNPMEKEDVIEARRLQIAFTREEATSTSQVEVVPDLMSMIRGNKLRVLMVKCYFAESIKIRKVSPLMNLKRLRVLVLKVSAEALPDSIVNLKLLRYLDLSYSEINALPEGVTALYYLQTLKLNGCLNLRELPVDLTRKLINLRHLGMRYTPCEIPKEISRLRYLQTLPEFIVSKERGRGISELKFLNHLRGDLTIESLENVETKEDAESADLIKKQTVHHLTLRWSYERHASKKVCHEEVLESLRPHNNLKGLTVRYFMGAKFPTWLKNDAYILLPNLVEIHLESLAHCAHLPAFGSFRKLRALKLAGLSSVTCIGDDFYGRNEQPFPSLRVLRIFCLLKLEEWNEATISCSSSSSLWCSFPVLEELSISDSPHLKIVPTRFPMLRKLFIDDTNSTIVMKLGIASKLTSLISLEISSIPDLVEIPTGFLSNNKLLQRLQISECRMLQSFPAEELEYLSSLQELEVGGFSGTLDSFPFLSALAVEQKGSSHHLSGLKILSLCESNITSLPEQIQSFTSLKELKISNFPNIVSLPDSLGNLSSLRCLDLKYCSELMHLPSRDAMLRLTTLQTLRTYRCDKLEARCANDQGEEWHKITHIPRVRLNTLLDII